MAAVNLKTVAGRSRTAPRRDPYWEKVEGTLHVGWRKMTSSGDAHWLARMLDPSGKRVFKTIGVLSEHTDADRWNVAKREAEAWALHINNGGSSVPKTVAEACQAYVVHLNKTNPKAATDAQKRYGRYVTDNARFAATELTKLTRQQIAAWRQALADRPIHRGSGRGVKPAQATNQKRSASSLNRDMTPFRAALNHAFEQGWVMSDQAWRVELKPIKDADTKRDGYLDRAQRKALIEATEGGIHNFVKALCMLPVRPGALAALTVSNYDPRRKQLSVTVDKTGARQIVLPDHAAAFFAEQCKGKLPGAYIFPQDNGKPLDKDAWKWPIKAAVAKAGLPDSTTAYSLRHTAITDLVSAGLPTLTVAQISGTSIRMIEKHYGHLLSTAATAALAALAI